MESILFKLGVVFLIMASLFACDTVAGPTDPAPTIQTVTTYQGEWTGKTSEGLTVSFTVYGNSVMIFEIDMIQNYPGAEAVSRSFYSSGDTAISGDTFSLKLASGNWGGGILVYGTPANGYFTSTTSAQGSAGRQPNIVTWTAEKK